MGKIRARFKTSFGELEIEGDSPHELLDALKTVTPEFIETVNIAVSTRVASVKAGLDGIVELTTEGPVVTTREKLTHYEAVGLVLFASDNKTSTSALINQLLKSSGIKSMVPARLNEMTKRGLVFKPDPSRPEFKLTVQGEKWIEDNLLPKLRSTTS
jgi:hypothetical protein